MKIEFDPAKREWTLRVRGLDMAKAGQIFDRFEMTHEDPRDYYGEVRFLTLGLFADMVVVCVWTQRNDAQRIISLRKANKDEREVYNLYRP